MPSTPARITGPNPDSHPSSSRCPAEVVRNSATPSSPPIGSSAAATLRSRCVSTPPVTRHGATSRSECVSAPPVTGRAASTMVTVIPSAWQVSRDGAAAQQRGAGAIALLAQGDPPRYGAVLAPHQPGPGRRIVLKTGKPSADSRAKPEPKRSRQYSFNDRKMADCHRSTTLHHCLRSPSISLSHILPADSVRLATTWRRAGPGAQIGQFGTGSRPSSAIRVSSSSRAAGVIPVRR